MTSRCDGSGEPDARKVLDCVMIEQTIQEPFVWLWFIVNDRKFPAGTVFSLSHKPGSSTSSRTSNETPTEQATNASDELMNRLEAHVTVDEDSSGGIHIIHQPLSLFLLLIIMIYLSISLSTLAK